MESFKSSNDVNSITAKLEKIRFNEASSEVHGDIDYFLEKYSAQIAKLSLPEKTTDTILEISKELVQQFASFSLRLMEESNGFDDIQSLNEAKDYICQKLTTIDTSYKRTMQTKSQETYLVPQELALGTHWEMKQMRKNAVAIPQLLQSRFQYIRISETIKNLFCDDTFRSIYMQYNDNDSGTKHKCADGVFQDFCCGSVYKNTALYSKHPNSLQIKISSDDFTVANPLGPRATVHKLCAIYFNIQNMPKEYLSKLDNIYLVCLAHTDDLKTPQTDFNDIWRVIVEDIRVLETDGIELEDGTILRGSISCLGFDNLGAHQALGLVESFRSTYCCRICTLPSKVCEQSTREVISKYRNKAQYEESLKKIAVSTKVNYAETMGIKRYCVLNELSYFNIFENLSVDAMHDLQEGTIAFAIKHFCSVIMSYKILNERDLQKKIEFFNYGQLNSKNNPSLLCLTKNNLNQTASQMTCLLFHIPFIFYDFKGDKRLVNVWDCIQSLIFITRTIYSAVITEKDILDLEEQVENHLQMIKETFKVALLPKHHLLTHYGSVIRRMGPVLYMNMMRSEAKHQQLKRLANSTQNFINITKTIATKHQKQLAYKIDTYSNVFEYGKRVREGDDLNTELLISSLSDSTQSPTQISKFRVNNKVYKSGFFLLSLNYFYEIIGIYLHENKHYFVCVKWIPIKFDRFLNSNEIVESETADKVVLKYENLKIKQIYEKKKIGGKAYIIVDTLESIIGV